MKTLVDPACGGNDEAARVKHGMWRNAVRYRKLNEPNLPSAREGAGLARRLKVTAVITARCFRFWDRLASSESLEAQRFEPCVDRKATLGEFVERKASTDAGANKSAMRPRTFMIALIFSLYLSFGRDKRDNDVMCHGVGGHRRRQVRKRYVRQKI